MWQLEVALTVIRLLQPNVHALGYHVALGGGVLNNGQSDKDLDLYFLPLGQGTPEPKALRYYLTTVLGVEYSLGGPSVRPADIDLAYPPEPMWINGRYTYRSAKGLRTDVFIA